MNSRNAGKFYAVNSGLKVNNLGGIKMEIPPEVNFKCFVAGSVVYIKNF